MSAFTIIATYELALRARQPPQRAPVYRLTDTALAKLFTPQQLLLSAAPLAADQLSPCTDKKQSEGR
ncbi:MAG: hypothetical protein EBU31_13840 [Proteobacteria bacterium]|nr:hypothetical protein [Pseudomonadota bacterium]